MEAQKLHLPGIWDIVAPVLLRKANLKALKNTAIQWLETECKDQPLVVQGLKTLDEVLDVVIEAVGR